MNKISRNIFIVFLLIVIGLNSALACTGISLQYKNHYFLGKNHDWISKYAAFVINPRGIINHDPLYMRKDKLLNWASKYGSVTVNVVEKNKVLPGAMVGMNEKGLGVLSLWQINAQYPIKPKKPVVPTDLFAKYILDNAATVSEAVQLAKKIDVEPSTLSNRDANILAKTLGVARKTLGNIDLHIFIQDNKGSAAVIEYVRGQLAIHNGKTLPILAISNNSYSDSIKHLKKFSGFGGSKNLPGGFDSLSRFVKAAYVLKIMSKPKSKEQAISHLFNDLTYTQNLIPNTQWTAVFDLSSKTLYLRSIDNQQIRIVRFNKFDISKGQPIRFLSINNDLSGYVENKFKTPNGTL